MIHMYAVPHSIASLPHSAPVGIGNMAYVTNTEIDNSGTLRAIHSHEDITEIGLVYQGNGVHLIDGALYHIKPGDLLLYNTKVLHQDIASSDEPMRFFLCGVTGLHLDGLRPGSIVPNPSGGSCHVESGVYFDFILNGFHMLEYSLKKQQSNVSEMAHGFLYALIAIIRGLTEQVHCTAKGEAHSPDLSLAEEMRQYINLNYASNFTLNDLAQRFHINRFYASHVFSETFGTSPMQYRTRRRIGEAQSLLTSTDCTITYISSIVGYDDPNRFSQVFSQIVGMSPSKYRDLSVRSPQPFRK